MLDRKDIINKRLEETIKMKKNFSDELKEKILKVSDAIINSHKNKKRVFLFGNGGSAADAQHFEAELVGRFCREKEPMDVIALTTNSSIFTALINDYPAEEVFSRQVMAHVNKGDIVIGITTSGNSPNVIKGIVTAREKGALTFVLTGQSGGELASLTDVHDNSFYDIMLNVPSLLTPRIQELHVFVIHLICEFVEDAIIEKMKE